MSREVKGVGDGNRLTQLGIIISGVVTAYPLMEPKQMAILHLNPTHNDTTKSDNSTGSLSPWSAADEC